ncbi:MAG: DegV family protein [Acidobacteriota bacterium]
MARPTVLVVDPETHRRQELSQGLASFGYEVVAAGDEAEGRKFALGLGPQVVVADAKLGGFGDATILGEFAAESKPLLILLVETEAAAEEVPEEAYAVPTQGLTTKALLRKLRTVLVGKEVGLKADERLESLLGDDSALAFFDLLPLLQRSVVTGRVLFAGGEVALEGGEVIAARLGPARGVKAFARLGRVGHGTYRVLLGLPGAEREIREDLLTLMATAIEDQHTFNELVGQFPGLEARVQVVMGPGFFATQFTSAQQQILGASQDSPSLRELLDRVPLLDGQVLAELVRLKELGFVAFAEPELKVRVVTDSTSDLPPEVAAQHHIQVVPVTVFLGEEIHKDGVDITPREFYRRLASDKDIHPRTNPPTPGEFLTFYRQLVEKSDLVSVHVSEKMSQTIVHARQAVAENRDKLESLAANRGVLQLEIVDSRSVSIALGLLALFAARMALRGLRPGEIRERLEDMRERVHMIFVVDTLEYLARGGRIGKARALLGQMLGIKPILTVADGEVAPLDKVRGGRAAHPRVIQLFKERVDATQPAVVAIAHAQAPVWADRLKNLIQENFQVAEFLECEAGPGVGANVGPGAVAAAMFQPREDEAPLIAPLPRG